ncbi:hypothetical protein PRIPAC_94711 [Pristionchus pacificus]|nr:hypothetical protein PRIPAC_94711 [Pristionchus pacificus]
MYYLPSSVVDSNYPFPSYPYQSAGPSSPPFHGLPQHSSCSPPVSPSNSFENVQSLLQFPVIPITYSGPVHPNNVSNNFYYASPPNSFYQSQHSNLPQYPVHSCTPPSLPNSPPQYLSRSSNSIAVAPPQTIRVPQSLTPTSPVRTTTTTRPLPVPVPLEPSPKGPISYAAVAAKSPPPKSPTSLTSAIKRNVTEPAKVASKTSKKREEIDLDRMTKRNGGKLMHCEYSAKMQKFNSRRKAEVEKMMALHEKYNRFLDKDVMDLHYLPCTLAKEAFSERLTEIKARKRPNEIYVVTGE